MSDDSAAPDFRCSKCGRSVGASRETPGPWIPAPCYRCETLPAERKDVARRRALGNVAAGIDLDLAFAAYRKRPPFVGNLGAIELTVGHKANGHFSGHAKPRSRKIRVAFGPAAKPEHVLEVLVHEMCHCACPPREWHGERFRLTLRRAASELWGIDVPLLTGKNRGEERNAAYAMDRLIMTELEKKIALGGVDLFPPAPKAPKPSRAELSKKLVEKRAAHATKMLARAVARLRRAETIEKKWRAKVRRYKGEKKR